MLEELSKEKSKRPYICYDKLSHENKRKGKKLTVIILNKEEKVNKRFEAL